MLMISKQKSWYSMQRCSLEMKTNKKIFWECIESLTQAQASSKCINKTNSHGNVHSKTFYQTLYFYFYCSVVHISEFPYSSSVVKNRRLLIHELSTQYSNYLSKETTLFVSEIHKTFVMLFSIESRNMKVPFIYMT